MTRGDGIKRAYIKPAVRRFEMILRTRPMAQRGQQSLRAPVVAYIISICVYASGCDTLFASKLLRESLTIFSKAEGFEALLCT